MRSVCTLLALASSTIASAATLTATGDACPGPWEITASELTTDIVRKRYRLTVGL